MKLQGIDRALILGSLNEPLVAVMRDGDTVIVKDPTTLNEMYLTAAQTKELIEALKEFMDD